MFWEGHKIRKNTPITFYLFEIQLPFVLSESSREHRDSTKGSSSSGVSSDLSDSDHDIDDHTKVFDFHIEASTQTSLTQTQGM